MALVSVLMPHEAACLRNLEGARGDRVAGAGARTFVEETKIDPRPTDGGGVFKGNTDLSFASATGVLSSSGLTLAMVSAGNNNVGVGANAFDNLTSGDPVFAFSDGSACRRSAGSAVVS